MKPFVGQYVLDFKFSNKNRVNAVFIPGCIFLLEALSYLLPPTPSLLTHHKLIHDLKAPRERLLVLAVVDWPLAV